MEMQSTGILAGIVLSMVVSAVVQLNMIFVEITKKGVDRKKILILYKSCPDKLPISSIV